MTAERAIIEIELVANLLVDGVGDANGTGLGEPLEPGGDIDAIPEDVIAVDDHVTKIDADAKLEAAMDRD
jgi:hypothetical protein